MNDHTGGGEALLARRRADLASFVANVAPAVAEFVQVLAPDQAAQCLENIELFLPFLDRLLRDEVLDESTTVWAGARVMYVLGEYLRTRFNGVWVVDDVPGSPWFARYVMDVPTGRTSRYRIDPADVALRFLRMAPPRSIYTVLDPILPHLMGAPRSP